MDDQQIQSAEEFTLEVEGIFGDDAGSRTIAGSVSALTALQEAFATGLVISAELSSGQDAFDGSCAYFQDIAAMPDFRQASILDELNDEKTRAVTKLDDISGEGKPPFQLQYLNIDGIPRLLRCLSKYHGQRYFGKFNYSLGILNLLPDGSMTAQVFASTLQKVVSHTIWIFRRIAAPVNIEEQYSEVYSAFVLPDGVAGPGAQFAARPELRTSQRGAKANHELDQEPPESSAKKAGITERQTAKSRGGSAAAWQNKTLMVERGANATNFDDGRLHPDDVQGEMVLELVPYISTADLQARINRLYEKLNGEKRGSNFATLRFRNALIAKCEREGLNRKDEWVKIQNRRRNNKVKPDTGNPPALYLGMNKGNKYAKKKDQAVDQDVEMDDVEVEQEEVEMEEMDQ